MNKIILDEDRLDLAKLFTGTGVEIGVADGWYSTKIMELGLVDKLYGVDPYRRHRGYMDYTRESTFEKLRTNAHNALEKYYNYEFIEDFSVNAAERFDNDSLDFVYIDGDHSYEATLADLDAWYFKVKPGGIIAGDDYIRSHRDKKHYDVIRAVDQFVAEEGLDLYLYHKGRNPTNFMFRKPA